MTTLLLQTGTATTTSTSGDSTWLAIGLGLAALAIVFFALELFIPSGGVLAIVCAAAVFGSIASLFAYNTSAGLFALFAYLVVTPFAVIYGIKLWAKTPIGRNLILGSTESARTNEMDEESAAMEAVRIRDENLQTLRAMIGRKGEVITTLRPVGVVLIDGERVDALAESGVIEEGEMIEVVAAYDNQLKVRIAS